MKPRHLFFVLPDAITHHFLFYLDWSSLLDFRGVNRECFFRTKSLPSTGPYRSPAHFIMSESTLLENKESKPTFDAVKCTAAWEAYLTVFFYMDSPNPAIFYKIRQYYLTLPDGSLRHYNADASKTFEHISQGEDMLGNGRQYCPFKKHSWFSNAAWELALIHAERSIYLISPLTDDYVFRAHSSPSTAEYSAFAKEIGALYVARTHLIVGITEEGYIQIKPRRLLFSDKNFAELNRIHLLKIKDINPTDEQCLAATEAVNLAIDYFKTAQTAARDIENLLIEKSLGELENLSQEVNLFIEQELYFFEKLEQDKTFRKQHITNTYLIYRYFIDAFNKGYAIGELRASPTDMSFEAVIDEVNAIMQNRIAALIEQIGDESRFSPVPVEDTTGLSQSFQDLCTTEHLSSLSMFNPKSEGGTARPACPSIDSPCETIVKFS